MDAMPEEHRATLADPTQGMSNEMYDSLFIALGLVRDVDYTSRHYGYHWHTYAAFKNLLWGRRAICAVRSKNYADNFHFIYWDGHHVFDPSTKEVYTDEDWRTWAEPFRVYIFNETERPRI